MALAETSSFMIIAFQLDGSLCEHTIVLLLKGNESDKEKPGVSNEKEELCLQEGV